MKKIHWFLTLILTAFILSSCGNDNSSKDYASYVNPYIGTGGHGHTFPGAAYPNGMVQLSPDTRIYGWDACSGYHYTDSTINGFSHTHLSGTGIADYGDILIMPITGTADIRQKEEGSDQVSFASGFKRENEKASPGYYSVILDRYNVKVELTTSPRSGFHRYTFPAQENAGIIIDLDYAIGNQKTLDLTLEKVSDTEIRGFKRTSYWAPDQVVYFYAQFSKPFKAAQFYEQDSAVSNVSFLTGKSAKALLTFDTKENEEILVKVGISPVDLEGAKKNLLAEIPSWDFNSVHANARKAWNDVLRKVDIETQDSVQREIFYTALYHTYIAPNLFSDVDGRYRGMDGNIHSSNENVYTVFSLWDTMRALHPMLTIIDTDLNQNLIRSLLLKHAQGGILPMWELAGNYTATMIGYNAAPVIVDSYMKGYRNFDTDLAYEALLKVSSYDTTNIVASPLFKHALMPLSKKYKNEIGYIPAESEHESVAKGLEYAYDDWCILQMAKDRKDAENIKKYEKLALNYKNYFDAETGFMRGKHADGSWRTPFNPRSSTHRVDDYCEGTAWQWLWFVPHDVNGLTKLLGGREKFLEKLDGLFTADSNLEGETVSADISGLIGQYAHGNEPSHHILHLYNYTGVPHKTQELVDSVLYSLYHAAPDGLSGNEDCGQMSAWYILNAMGFYQVSPGDPVYSIGRPIFDKTTINLANGKKFTIVTKNNSRKNKYIQSVKLNGKVLEKPFFTHEQLIQGGELEVELGDKPNFSDVPK